MGDSMQEFDETKEVKDNSYFLQTCIPVEDFYDYEFSDEFFVLAPVDVNDLYNQN